MNVDDFVSKLARMDGPGPFDRRDVAGPYHLYDWPVAELVSNPTLAALESALVDCRAGKVSPPVLLLEGETGAGKTFILNRLVRKFHGAPSQTRDFAIHIPARTFIEAPRFIEGLAAGVEAALRSEAVPGFTEQAGSRPVDYVAWFLARSVWNDRQKNRGREVRMKWFWFLKRRLPVEVREYAEAPRWPGRFSPSDENREIDDRAFEALAEARTHEVDRKLMRLASGRGKPLFDSSLATEELTDRVLKLLDRLEKIGLRPVFLFDQFEDFQASDSQSQFRSTAPFYLRLFDWLRDITKSRNPHEVPPCVLSVVRDASPHAVNDAHLQDRIARVIRHAPDLRVGRRPGLDGALDLTRVMLDAYWERYETQNRGTRPTDESYWPFGNAEVIGAMLAGALGGDAVERLLPREWIRILQQHWRQLIQDGGSFSARKEQWLARLHGSRVAPSGSNNGATTSVAAAPLQPAAPQAKPTPARPTPAQPPQTQPDEHSSHSSLPQPAGEASSGTAVRSRVAEVRDRAVEDSRPRVDASFRNLASHVFRQRIPDRLGEMVSKDAVKLAKAIQRAMTCLHSHLGEPFPAVERDGRMIRTMGNATPNWFVVTCKWNRGGGFRNEWRDEAAPAVSEAMNNWTPHPKYIVCIRPIDKEPVEPPKVDGNRVVVRKFDLMCWRELAALLTLDGVGVVALDAETKEVLDSLDQPAALREWATGNPALLQTLFSDPSGEL